MQDTYSLDPVKAKAREEIFRFANAKLPKDRSQGKAIYLASRNDLETRILDRLGFPREGRIILEMDPERFPIVKKANPGITVLPMSTHEFFKSEKAKEFGPFWYMGLDYECQLNDSVMGDLTNIADRDLLIDGGVIYTNVVGQREGSYMKGLYLSADLAIKFSGTSFSWRTNNFNKWFRRYINFNGNEDQVREFLNNMIQGKDSPSVEELKKMPPLLVNGLKDLRGNSLQFLIQRGLDSSQAPDFFTDFSFIPTGENSFKNLRYTLIREFPSMGQDHNHTIGIRGLFTSKQFPCVIDVNRCMGCTIAIKTASKNHVTAHRPLYGLINEINFINDSLEKYVKVEKEGVKADLRKLEKMFQDYYFRGFIGIVPKIIQNLQSPGYVVSSADSFSYISNKNTQMLLDILSLKKISGLAKGVIDPLIEQGASIIYTKDRPYLVRVDKETQEHMNICNGCRNKNSKETAREIENRAGPLIDFLRNGFIPPVKRKDLGSSFKQPLRSSMARQCVIDGLSDEQITEKYQVGEHGWRKIGALRACKTMGTLKIDTPVIESKPKERQINQEDSKTKEKDFSKYLVSREVYRSLPSNSQKRINLFLEDILPLFSEQKQDRIRQAFAESHAYRDLKSLEDPYRVYTFFDEIQYHALKGTKIDKEFLNERFRFVSELKELVSVVQYAPSKVKKVRKLREVPALIKQEIREYILKGFTPDEVYAEYKGHFSNRIQFGAVIAWASPNLSSKRKNR